MNAFTEPDRWRWARAAMPISVALATACSWTDSQPKQDVVPLDSMSVSVYAGLSLAPSYRLAYYRGGIGVLNANPVIPGDATFRGLEGKFVAVVDSARYAAMEHALSEVGMLENPDTTEFYGVDASVTVVMIAAGTRVVRLFASQSDSAKVVKAQEILEREAMSLNWVRESEAGANGAARN